MISNSISYAYVYVHDRRIISNFSEIRQGFHSDKVYIVEITLFVTYIFLHRL